MRFFANLQGLTAEPDYAGRDAGLFEGGRALLDGRPLWLHSGCGHTLALDGRPPLEHDGCDQPGEWHAVMIPVGAVTRPPADLDYLERRTAAALRYGPGNTSVAREYRWRHKATGAGVDQLDARHDPDDYAREVRINASSVSRWVEVR